MYICICYRKFYNYAINVSEFTILFIFSKIKKEI